MGLWGTEVDAIDHYTSLIQKLNEEVSNVVTVLGFLKKNIFVMQKLSYDEVIFIWLEFPIKSL